MQNKYTDIIFKGFNEFKASSASDKNPSDEESKNQQASSSDEEM